MGRDIVYSDHAEEQMAARSIAKFEVTLTLNNPDSVYPGADGATNHWKYIDDRTIRVTFSKSVTTAGKVKTTTILIITVALKEVE